MIINPFGPREVPMVVQLFIKEHVPKIKKLMDWDTKKAVYWFFSENPGLGFKTPVDLIDQGQGYIVKDFIDDSIKRSEDRARIEDKKRADTERARAKDSLPI